jgi:uncharacterized protein YdaU (DUF1376 family)
MNFFKLHIGDYLSHTGYLTPLEDGIYLRLLMRYYMTEKPLPSDQKELARLIRARSRWEVQALARCVNYYFSVASDGLLHNPRADKEIQQYQAMSNANRTNAAMRWQSEATSERNANQNQIPEPVNHTPSSASTAPSSNSAPEEKKAAPLPSKSNGKTTKAGAWAIELRRLGVAVTSMHPTMLQWIEDGFELPSVIEALQVARQRKPEPEKVPVAYLDPILRTPPKAPTASWWASEQATIAKGREVGLEPRPGEDWDAFRGRIRTVSAN